MERINNLTTLAKKLGTTVFIRSLKRESFAICSRNKPIAYLTPIQADDSPQKYQILQNLSIVQFRSSAGHYIAQLKQASNRFTQPVGIELIGGGSEPICTLAIDPSLISEPCQTA